MTSLAKLTVRLPEAVHRAAKGKAAEEGVALEDVIAGFLAQWVEPERLERVKTLLDGKNGEGVKTDAVPAQRSKKSSKTA